MHTQKCLFRGLDAVELALDDGSRAVVTLGGAQVVSWTLANGVQQMYMSPSSGLAPGQALRGGVPLIFPQFSNRGPLLRHGFARISQWQVLRQDAGPGLARVEMGLQGNGGAWQWPHDYALELAVTLTPQALSLTLSVHNPGSQPFHFTAALHTYFQVGARDSVCLEGLLGQSYEDSMADGRVGRDDAPTLCPKDALDRVYLNTPAQLLLRSDNGTLALQSEGFEDTVVWNPTPASCANSPDLPPDAYRHFLCVEAARIGRPVRLESGARWSGTQHLRAEAT